MADHILDTFTGGAHTLAASGGGSDSDFTGPTNSTVPNDWGMRETVLRTFASAGPSSATMSLGGGQLNMAWEMSNLTGGGVHASLQLGYFFTSPGAPLGAMPILSIPGSGSIAGDYASVEFSVGLTDVNGLTALWLLPTSTGAFNGGQFDLSTVPDDMSPGFDFNSVSRIVVWFAAYLEPIPGATGTGSITLTQIDIVPTPGAAALLGLGGLMAARRRR
ncbi:MAG: hypothetical protein ACREJO_04995 [Phycisphaerales bacterium]